MNNPANNILAPHRLLHEIVCFDADSPDGLRRQFSERPTAFIAQHIAAMQAIGSPVTPSLSFPCGRVHGLGPEQLIGDLTQERSDALAVLAERAQREGWGRPIVSTGMLTTVQAIQWVREGFDLRIEDAMGRQDDVARLALELRECGYGGAQVMAEAIPLNHRLWPRATAYDLRKETLAAGATHWLARESTWGRGVIEPNNLTPPEGSRLYLLLRGGEQPTLDVLQRYAELGLGFAVQAIGAESAIYKALQRVAHEGWPTTITLAYTAERGAGGDA